MKLNYSSNNSGGSWWLCDDDWKNLEDAGWEVDWIREREDRDGERFLGALAYSASKVVSSRSEANDQIREFERITGQSVDDQGCNCCGAPHYFTLYDDNDEYIASFNSYPIEYERDYF